MEIKVTKLRTERSEWWESWRQLVVAVELGGLPCYVSEVRPWLVKRRMNIIIVCPMNNALYFPKGIVAKSYND
jgi:hypothetical protein